MPRSLSRRLIHCQRSSAARSSPAPGRRSRAVVDRAIPPGRDWRSVSGSAEATGDRSGHDWARTAKTCSASPRALSAPVSHFSEHPIWNADGSRWPSSVDGEETRRRSCSWVPTGPTCTALRTSEHPGGPDDYDPARNRSSTRKTGELVVGVVQHAEWRRTLRRRPPTGEGRPIPRRVLGGCRPAAEERRGSRTRWLSAAGIFFPDLDRGDGEGRGDRPDSEGLRRRGPRPARRSGPHRGPTTMQTEGASNRRSLPDGSRDRLQGRPPEGSPHRRRPASAPT